MTTRPAGGFGCPPARTPATPIPPGEGCRPGPGPGQTTRYGTVPDPVAWYEGMMLAPQHFQQSALQAEAALGYHLAALAPWHWGVRRLAIDCPALADGVLGIQQLEAVMPDGLVVRYQAGTDPELRIDLKPFAASARRGVLTVHLAVRPRASAPAAGTPARWECTPGETVEDDLGTGGAVEVARMRPRLTLVVSAQRPRGWVSFPLARIRRTAAGFVLDDAAPPLLALATGLPLTERCADLACTARGRAVSLARAVRRGRAAGDAQRAAAAQAGLAAVTAALPRLEALVHSGVAHPREVHLALCDFAGQLGPVGPGVPAPLFPAYDHDDPHRSLGAVLDFCETALDEVQDAWFLFAFRHRRGAFRLLPRPAWKDRAELLVGAVAPRGLTGRELAAWVARARIASASRMPALAAGEGPGAPREVIAAPPGLPAADGRVYFRVAVDRRFVIPGERLQVLPPVACAPSRGPRRLMLCIPIAAAPQPPAPADPGVTPDPASHPS
ncbi:MAG TPA: type VI secretion system baseplate subunit TssK [Longimicrobium sp.]|jgi:type VI secretion system protein ImpJ|uniref:type VI secretion system baseplate subunit TssK n=1 Tax=Longimicrobium sp. TaxID=2029185 RepID=UPI002EDB4089